MKNRRSSERGTVGDQVLAKQHRSAEGSVSRREILATLACTTGLGALAYAEFAGPALAEAVSVGEKLDLVAAVDSIGTRDQPRALRKSTGPKGRAMVVAAGFYEPADGGGGVFRWMPDPSPPADDGGIVVVPDLPAPSGYWRRIFSGPLNVKWFGAKGDDAANDRPAIQRALSAVDSGGGVFFPPGTYKVWEDLAAASNLEKGLYCLDNSRVTLFGQQATIRAAGVWSSNSALLNVSGLGASCIRDLRLFAVATLSQPPAAGLVLGRDGSHSGAGNLLLNLHVSGPFTTACLYNCCSETNVGVHCRFTNLADRPAYFDSSDDVAELTGLVVPSNVVKTFYGCSFSSTTSFADPTSRVVELHGGQRAVRFKDCFFSYRGGQGVVFWMDGTSASTSRLTLEDVRVERNHRDDSTFSEDQQNSRLIRYAKSGPLTGLEIRGLSFTPRSEAGHPDPILIELAGGDLTNSEISVLEGEIHGLPRVILAHSGARIEGNKLTVPGDGAIEVAADAEARHNVVFDMGGSGSPFAGNGTIESNHVISAA